MKSVISNNLSLKYQRFMPSVSKDKGIKNLSVWQRINSDILLCVYHEFHLCTLLFSCSYLEHTHIHSTTGNYRVAFI